jgi:hypothetical protein
MHGFSDLMVEVFGERVGTRALPRDLDPPQDQPVEIELIVAVRDG